MLDDLKYIAQRDAHDALGVVEKQPTQLGFDFGIAIPHGDYTNVVVVGMGGSALAATLLADWPQPQIPITISRSPKLPSFVDEHTLCIFSSYSGNTDEVIDAYEQARDVDCQKAVISSGGELSDKARADGVPLAFTPSGIQPRDAVWYMYRAIVEIFESAGLGDNWVSELEDVIDSLSAAAQEWRADVPTKHNYAKQIAEEIAGKTPVIYASEFLSAAAYKWKIDCNENAKNVAFSNVLPEMNHNEMIGWTSHPVQKLFAPIELMSDEYSDRTKQRFEIMNRLLSGRMPHPIQITARGETQLEQLLWLVLLGDFVSTYLGLINNVDPTQIDLIEKFKEQLGS